MCNRAEKLEFGTDKCADEVLGHVLTSLSEGRPSVRVNTSRHPHDEEIVRFRGLLAESSLGTFTYNRAIVVTARSATVH